MIKLIKSSFYNEAKTKKLLSAFIKDSKIFSMNSHCDKFETEFTKKQKRKHTIFVNSGSSANLLLLQALLNLGKLKKGDRVGFSALTWATNVMPIIQLGLIPVAIDCEIDTLNCSPAQLKKQKNLNCFFITNALGFSDNLQEIQNFCAEKNIILLEDNCESLGSKAYGKLLGNFSLASTFSFYVGHHLSTVEGGMVCTDDHELNEMLIMARAHGWDRNLPPQSQKRLQKKYKIDPFRAKYTFYDLGYNFRPNDITGFIGTTQIGYWDEIVKKRERNFKKFQKAMQNNEDLLPIKTDHIDIISNFAMPIICKDQKSFKKYIKKFTKNQVEIRPIIAGNIIDQPFYKKHIKEKSKCKNADFIQKNGFYFGNNPELTDKEITILSNLLKK